MNKRWNLLPVNKTQEEIRKKPVCSIQPNHSTQILNWNSNLVVEINDQNWKAERVEERGGPDYSQKGIWAGEVDHKDIRQVEHEGNSSFHRLHQDPEFSEVASEWSSTTYIAKKGENIDFFAIVLSGRILAVDQEMAVSALTMGDLIGYMNVVNLPG